jgi:hypothetical protein
MTRYFGSDLPPALWTLGGVCGLHSAKRFVGRIEDGYCTISPFEQKTKTWSFPHSFPRPPQTPAAPIKQAYRKCRPSTVLLTRAFWRAALPISPSIFKTLSETGQFARRRRAAHNRPRRFGGSGDTTTHRVGITSTRRTSPAVLHPRG